MVSLYQLDVRYLILTPFPISVSATNAPPSLTPLIPLPIPVSARPPFPPLSPFLSLRLFIYDYLLLSLPHCWTVAPPPPLHHSSIPTYLLLTQFKFGKAYRRVSLFTLIFLYSGSKLLNNYADYLFFFYGTLALEKWSYKIGKRISKHILDPIRTVPHLHLLVFTPLSSLVFPLPPHPSSLFHPPGHCTFLTFLILNNCHQQNSLTCWEGLDKLLHKNPKIYNGDLVRDDEIFFHSNTSVFSQVMSLNLPLLSSLFLFSNTTGS